MEWSRAKIFCLNAVGANHDFRYGQVIIHKDAYNIGKVLPRIEIFWHLKAGRKDFQGKRGQELFALGDVCALAKGDGSF